MNNKSLSETVESAQNGNLHDMELLYNRSKNLIFNIAWQFTRNVSDAEDLFQEIFIKRIQNITTRKHFIMAAKQPINIQEMFMREISLKI